MADSPIVMPGANDAYRESRDRSLIRLVCAR
jgi:hypothetical protein